MKNLLFRQTSLYLSRCWWYLFHVSFTQIVMVKSQSTSFFHVIFFNYFHEFFFLVRVKFPKLFRNIQAFFAWDGSAPIEKDLSKIKHLVQLKTIKRNFCPSDSNLLYFNFLSVTLFSQYGDNSFSTLFHKSHFLTIPGQWHFTEFLQNLVKLYA